MGSIQSFRVAERSKIRLALLASAAFALAALPSFAQDATWDGTSNDVWNNPDNWTPPPVPTGVAIFDGVTGNSAAENFLTFSASADIGTIQFLAGTPVAYEFDLSGVGFLSINGAGIVNNSAFAPTFITTGSLLELLNASTAGDAIINNDGGATTFADNSSAGTATITNDGNGTLSFTGQSTAGNSTITNIFGIVQFFGSSTAGNAVITNDDTIEFGGTASAGNATIINNFIVEFGASSTAGNSTITNNGGLGFFDNSTAGNARITTGFGGQTFFFDTSTGGDAVIRAANGGSVSFEDNSTAGNARLIADAGGQIDFTFTTGPLGDGNVSAGSIEGAGLFGIGPNNTLTVGSNNMSTEVSGVIADDCGCGPGGPGSLVKVGTGTLTLSGINTYSGTTTVNAGTLVIGMGGSIISNTTVNNTATFLVNGTSAAIAVNNSGTATVNGTSGAITVNNSGTATVNGTSGAVIVNDSGTLMGTGTVAGANIAGNLAPGNSIGTITIAGNLVLTAAASYIVEVSSAAADRTNVTGTATLAGTVSAIFEPGAFMARSYTILSAAGGRGGTTFGTLTTTNLPAGFTPSLTYTATDVLLNITATLGTLPNANLNRNQQTIANLLNNFFNAGGTLPLAFLSVFNLTSPSLGNALSQLSGEHASGGQQASFQSMSLFLSAMLDPFTSGRNGGFGAATPFAAVAPHPAEQAFAAAMPVKARPRADTFESRWHVWGSAYGGRNRTDGDQAVVGSNDLSASAAGFAGGLDYRVSPGTVLGAAVAVGESRWRVSGLGKGDAEAAQVGGYFSTRWNDLYLSAAVAGAWHRAGTDRTVTVAGTDRLQADFDARSLGARIEAGKRFGMMNHGITPYAAVQVQSLRTPDYAERATFGTNAFALAYASQTTTDTRSELGAWLDTRHRLDSGTQLTLRARAAWVHDFDTGRRIQAAFQTLPGTGFFTIDGAAAPRNAALTSAVAEAQLANGVRLIGKFDGEFSGRSRTYAGTGTVRYAW